MTLLPVFRAPARDTGATPAVREADYAEARGWAWSVYLQRTRFFAGEEYAEREPREWRRLKGRLARLRVDDERRIETARKRLA